MTDVHLIDSEVSAILSDHGVPAAQRLLIATLLHADTEGVAHIPPRQLANYLRAPGNGRDKYRVRPAGVPLIGRTLGMGMIHGIYAPGSTPEAIGVMFAHGISGGCNEH